MLTIDRATHDAIIAHAYVLDATGSPAHLDLALTTVRSLLKGHFG